MDKTLENIIIWTIVIFWILLGLGVILSVIGWFFVGTILIIIGSILENLSIIGFIVMIIIINRIEKQKE